MSLSGCVACRIAGQPLSGGEAQTHVCAGFVGLGKCCNCVLKEGSWDEREYSMLACQQCKVRPACRFCGERGDAEMLQLSGENDQDRRATNGSCYVCGYKSAC